MKVVKTIEGTVGSLVFLIILSAAGVLPFSDFSQKIIVWTAKLIGRMIHG